MWLVYALSASVIWGISYAASGRVIARGVSPLTFFALYTLAGAVMGVGGLAATGRLRTVADEIAGIGSDALWLVVAVVASGVGTFLIYMAIGEKNATLASLIEISYPVFVAFFAWLFFRDVHINLSTLAGGLLILSGVAVVYLGNPG